MGDIGRETDAGELVPEWEVSPESAPVSEPGKQDMPEPVRKPEPVPA